MKNVSIFVKDNNYSLQNTENYKKDCSVLDVSECIEKYSNLIMEYFKFIKDNVKTKNTNFSKFIIVRGLDTITNVFLYILYFTRNIALTYFHSQKSYYFYVEFVSQISDDEKRFLQLTSRDAATYVYKKTVFDISSEFKKMNEPVPNEFREKMDIIKIYIHLQQTYLLKIINSPTLDASYISDLSKIFEKLHKLQQHNSQNKQNTIALENITEKLYHKIEDTCHFFAVSNLLLKKCIKNPEIIRKVEKNVLYTEDFDSKLTESNDKFINWLLQ